MVLLETGRGARTGADAGRRRRPAVLEKTILAGALATFGVAMAVSVAGQTTSTVWNAVYTTTQARRGETIFKDECAVCHAEDLTGADGPALKGEPFTLAWEGRSLGRLFQRVRRMPPRRAPMELEDSRDALAFILQANGYPPGERELSTDASSLEEIAIVPKPQ
jgi:mono/diheme cytochrome c family protein